LKAWILAITLLIVPIVSGTNQIYPTNMGDVQIDVPYNLIPNENWGVSGTVSLGLKVVPKAPFSGDWRYVMGINLQNNWYAESLENFSARMIGTPAKHPEHTYDFQEMLTNDQHKMLFITISPKTGKEPSDYYAFIDYQKEKDRLVEINGCSETNYFTPIATFTKGEFQDVCKSFTFV